ncbi:MAG TPA: M56 family metallopeptidase, partial [Planctomycetaceae bacterium]|nr:M56 family metallopeptidase [Planctomycetaceae bacterium]
MAFFNFNSSLSQFVERLGWVLVHSLWQFALITIVSILAARVLRRNSSALRYGLLVAAMGFMVAAAIVTWSVVPVDMVMASREASASGFTVEAVAVPNLPDLKSEISDADAFGDQEAPRDFAPPSPTAPATSTSAQSPDENTRWADAQPLALKLADLFRPWLTWIVGFWIIGVLICSLRPLLGWRTLRRLRRIGLSTPSEEVLAAFQRVSTQLGMRRVVNVYYSALAKGPLVVGYLRPIVLLPISLATSIPMAQLEAILAHELAHIRRHDFVINLLQTLVETLFFYHPAVWWLSHRIRIEREHCCDDLVIKRFNNAPDYGRALLAVEQLQGQTTSLALGAKDGSLLERIRRIVSVRGNQADCDRPSALWISIAAICSICVLSATWGLVANDETPKMPQPAVATLPGNVTIELVGVSFHPSTGNDWWRPDGSELKTLPDLSDDRKFTVGSDAQARAKCREFLIQIRGLPKDHSVSTNYEASSASGSSFENGLWTGNHGAGPFNDSTTTIKLSIATEPFGPVQVFDRDGVKTKDISIRRDLKSLYDQIVPLGVREDSNETVLLLENAPYGDLYMLATWELVVVDTEGVHHRRNSEFVSALSNPRELRFPLPNSSISHFEYRVRPYRHFVTFENVSLEPGQKSEVKISVKSLPSDDAQAFIPNGPMIQLLGVSTPPIGPTSQEKREWWSGAGKLLDTPPVQPGSLCVGPDSADGREFAVRLSGCKSNPITHVSLVNLFQNGQPIGKPKNGHSMGATYSSQAPEFGCTIESVHWPIVDADAATIEVKFGETPAVVVKYDANGQRIEDADVETALQNSACGELLEGVKILRTGTHDDGFAVWTNNFSSSTDLGSLNLILIDKSGSKRSPFRSSGDGTENVRSFKVAPEDVAAIAIQLQAYTHVATFENVSLQPGKQTDVKASIESLPENIEVAKQDSARFEQPLQLKLNHSDAHNSGWFFVDLDRGKLLTPPFQVELNRRSLPWKVIQPAEEHLKSWLVKNSVDVILYVDTQPISGKPGQWKQNVQRWGIRTRLDGVNGLLRVPHTDGAPWKWNNKPDLVIKPFARRDESTRVSGFVPNSGGGLDVRFDSPDVQVF